jgi:hypothetical protein
VSRYRAWRAFERRAPRRLAGQHALARGRAGRPHMSRLLWVRPPTASFSRPAESGPPGHLRPYRVTGFCFPRIPRAGALGECSPPWPRSAARTAPGRTSRREGGSPTRQVPRERDPGSPPEDPRLRSPPRPNPAVPFASPRAPSATHARAPARSTPSWVSRTGNTSPPSSSTVNTTASARTSRPSARSTPSRASTCEPSSAPPSPPARAPSSSGTTIPRGTRPRARRISRRPPRSCARGDDSLISPFEASEEAGARAVAAIGHWLAATLGLPRVERIRVWMP